MLGDKAATGVKGQDLGQKDTSSSLPTSLSLPLCPFFTRLLLAPEPLPTATFIRPLSVPTAPCPVQLSRDSTEGTLPPLLARNPLPPTHTPAPFVSYSFLSSLFFLFSFPTW